jgi:hypothetical protein
VEDIRMCTESWGGREGGRESNGRGQMDQSEVYPQWGCIEKTPLNIDLEINNKDRTVKLVQCTGLLMRRGGGTKEMKVREYGGWTSCTYMK